MPKTKDRPFLLDVSRLVWRHWVGKRPTGIDRVCLAWLERYGDRSLAVVQYPRFRRILSAEASDSLFALFGHRQSAFKSRLVLSGLRNAPAVARGVAGRNRLYLNPGHTGLDKAGFQGWIEKEGLKPIHMIHDLIPITHPQFCRDGEAERHSRRMVAALKTASGFVCNSADTLHVLEQFAASQGLKMPPSTVAWLGSELSEAPPTRTAIGAEKRPTFVILGTIEGRKNHALLLDIWTRMIASTPEAVPELLVIGQRGWQCDEVFARLDTDPIMKGHVRELSSCTDEELAGHLGAASALLFPSHAEGFGMPLVESLAKGTPVIASDLAVFREIAGDVPDYANPTDLDRWESLIRDYALPRSALREAQLKRMKAVRLPRWDDHFASIDALIARLS